LLLAAGSHAIAPGAFRFTGKIDKVTIDLK
jgi:hypothetical protein